MRSVPLVLVAALLVPLVVAAPGPIATLQARSLDFAGAAQANGPLAALRIHTLDDADLSGDEGFRLTAPTLHVDVYEWTAAAGFLATTTGTPNHREADHLDTTIVAGSPYGMFELVIVPVPGHAPPRLVAAAAAGSLAHDPVTRVTGQDWASAEEHDGIGADTRDPVRLVTWTSLETLAIEGDFRLSLWSWNATAQSGQGPSTQYWSGQKEDPLTGPIGTTEGVRTNLRKNHVVFTVTDGRLEFGGLPPSPHQILWSSLEARALAFDLREARGFVEGIDGPLAVTAGTVRLQGQLAAALTGSTQGLDAEVTGVVEGAQADSHALELAATAASGAPSWTFPLAWLGLALVALAGAWGGRAAKRRRDQAAMDDLEAFAQLRDHAGVIGAAAKLDRHPDFGPDAAALKVDALLKLSRLDEADAYVRALRRWEGPAGPMHDYLHALVAVRRGEGERARRHLYRALAQAPELVAEAVRDAQLSPLVTARKKPAPEGYR